MLSREKFDKWCRGLNLSAPAISLVEEVRASAPARRVSNRAGNVIHAFPSRKMGHTVQAESRTTELAAVYLHEHRPETLEYWDQPPKIILRYHRKGRSIAFKHTADFFILAATEAGWEEWKPEEKLLELSREDPDRYTRDACGRWRCPPGEAYAAKFGLFYWVRSSAGINPILIRNLDFLHDYLREDTPAVSEEIATRVTALVTAHPGGSLKDLCKHANGGATNDQLFTLIAQKRIYVDWDAIPMTEPGLVRLFRDAATAKALTLAIPTADFSEFNGAKVIEAQPGTKIEWDGLAYSIVNVGRTTVALQSESGRFTELELPFWQNLLSKGAIRPLITSPETGGASTPESALISISMKGPRQLADANRRALVIRPRLFGQTNALAEMLKDEEIPSASARTERYWRSKYRLAEQSHGCGFVALLDNSHLRGNHSDRLGEKVRGLMNECIEKEYETAANRNLSTVHRALVLACSRQGLDAPSYKTFCLAVKDRQPDKQVKAREGKRVAYQKKHFYWRLCPDTPRHGDRPFGRGYMDHTELDVKLRCSRTGRVLGKPWVTFLIDGFTRRILAIWISFDPPSYRSCMMTLRVCVLRHGRLPQIIVVDNGKEFKSVYFDTLCARYEITKAVRPPSQARFGAVIERLFGTTNTEFVHQLEGNTKLDKNVRQVTRAVSSETHALWHLDGLYHQLCQFGYEIYDTCGHPALLNMSPRAATLEGLEVSGTRLHRAVAYDEMFRMMTLPSTRRGVAKVHNQKGIHLNGFDYWSDTLSSSQLEGRLVPVRYDPWNLSLAYALVPRVGWVRCQSEIWHLLQGHSEREFRLACEELKKQRSRNGRADPTARQIALFMNEVRAEELLLLRAREAANRQVLTLIEGGGSQIPSLSPGTSPHPSMEAAPSVSQAQSRDEAASGTDSDASTQEQSESTSSSWDTLDPKNIRQYSSF